MGTGGPERLRLKWYMGVGGVPGGYEEGLSVGLKELLANHSATQEGKAGLGSGCAQSGRRTADKDIVGRWKEHPTNTSSEEEREGSPRGKPHPYLLQRPLK